MEEVIVGPPQSGEVRIKIICTSLCHSCIIFLNLKDPPGYFPRILGHETIGVLKSVGDGVTELVEGDLAIPIFLPDCAECADCTSMKSSLCSKSRSECPLGCMMVLADSLTSTERLCTISFSCLVSPSTPLWTKVDALIPPDRACLLSCGVSTGVGAAWKSANVEAGLTVAIFGLGSIGLAVVEGARLCGAAKIIGVDVNPDKFEIGKKFVFETYA